MKQYIVALAKLLSLLKQYRKVSLFALSSFPCEISFALLRMLSRFNNSLDMAKAVIKNQKVLEYIDYTLG